MIGQIVIVYKCYFNVLDGSVVDWLLEIFFIVLSICYHVIKWQQNNTKLSKL